MPVEHRAAQGQAASSLTPEGEEPLLALSVDGLPDVCRVRSDSPGSRDSVCAMRNASTGGPTAPFSATILISSRPISLSRADRRS